MGVKFFKNVNQNVIRKVDEVAKQSNVVIFDNQDKLKRGVNIYRGRVSGVVCSMAK